MIESERQQCQSNAQAASALRDQEREAEDTARGYSKISVSTFELDAKSLAANQSKVSLEGAYIADGNVSWLLPSQMDLFRVLNVPQEARRVSKVPLMIDDADRSVREQFQKCRANPAGTLTQCSFVIIGHVTTCQMTTSYGAQLDEPCLAVETGRFIR